ncbi:hypothetical protein F383_27052 [Gossypium arboreum]|uniref:Uncharacterized protein n=1 Tax=Gossypium arboreum TaxID=29729 RepID=A0A0B0MSL7_GOSAR|nr:hypothetical protein F383_27052 [Gossypium arboreum]
MNKGGKLALEMAYFCPHGQRHERMSQPCVPWCCYTGV